MFNIESKIKRNLYGQTGNFQFNSILSIESLFGGVNIGVSGYTYDNNILKINTYCNSGKIFDDSGRFVGVYSPNKIFNISGNLTSRRYDLFIDNKPVSFGNIKQTGVINYFYISPVNTSCSYSFLANGERPNLLAGNVYCETGSPGTGYITNNTNLPVRIFSGDIINITNDSVFSLSGLFTGNLINSEVYNIIPKGRESLGDYNVNLRLYTNGGTIDYPVFISITGNEPPLIPYISKINGMNTIYHGQTRSYTSDIKYLKDDGLPILISLNHISGSGHYYTNIDVLSGYSGNLYGYIFNTGILAEYLTGIGTGQGGQLNNIGTGFSSGYISGVFTYARGGFVWPYTVPVTGYGTGLSYSGLGTGFYNGHVTGYIIGDSGTYLIDESGNNFYTRNVSNLLNVYATGFIHGSGQIYYNTPSSFDKLYIRANQDAIINNFHYTNRASLVSYLNNNTGIYWVTAAESGANAITISGIRGTETDVDIGVDSSNLGNMTVSGPRLYGGVDIGIGNINLITLDSVTGYLNHTFTGSGYYNSTGQGYIYGSGNIIDYTKTFTGTWNLFTGLDSQVNYRNFSFYNSDQNEYSNTSPVYYLNSSVLANVTYSNINDGYIDVALLTVTGSGFSTGVNILISGNYI